MPKNVANLGKHRLANTALAGLQCVISLFPAGMPPETRISALLYTYVVCKAQDSNQRLPRKTTQCPLVCLEVLVNLACRCPCMHKSLEELSQCILLFHSSIEVILVDVFCHLPDLHGASFSGRQSFLKHNRHSIAVTL